MQYDGGEYSDEDLLSLLSVRIESDDVRLVNVALAPEPRRAPGLSQRLMGAVELLTGSVMLLVAAVTAVALVAAVVWLAVHALG